MLLKEYYQLGTLPLKTKNGKDFHLVFVDPKASTDSAFDNKELLKRYGMEYLPYNRYIRNVYGVPHAWGWLVWNGQEEKVYPLIKKFAAEIGSQETAPENGEQRTMEEVLSSLESLKDVILQAEASGVDNFDGNAIVSNAEEYKKRLVQGIGSKETMEALAELMRFRTEMSKHRGHLLSMLNTLLIFLQKRNASDVRSRGEWADMGYTPAPDATSIVLTMPGAFKKLYGDKYKKVVADFLSKEGVESVNELTPSQKRRLDRATKYPDMSAGFKTYIAYDISDLIKGENAEEFPENTFKWYDKDSEETQKERELIDACIKFGKGIGIKDYVFDDGKQLGGARGSASSSGIVTIINDKKNHGLLSTVIHETAHQIMHWEIVKGATPSLDKYYRGGSQKRGSEIVEQEAELCAWIVLSGFGYEKQQEHFNYLANWGLNVNNCAKIFDDIMKVADFIYNGMIKNLQN